jgi:CheY-like chemotaxis protein
MAKLLVIDDDAHMLDSLSDVLKEAGHEVDRAASGLEALSLARDTVFDLVISDVRMAGMDGIECIEKLSQGRDDLKSIVITGYASDDVPARAMELDSCDYLFKPFTAEQLVLSVSRALVACEQPPAEGYSEGMRQAAAALGAMDAARQRALRSFYLGVRSCHLGAAMARVIWDSLEGVELHRIELLRELQLRLEADEMTERYLRLVRLCKSPTSTGILNDKPREGGVSRIAFQQFFRNIREGKIACDQLKIATQAREQAQSDPDLFASIWN